MWKYKPCLKEDIFNAYPEYVKKTSSDQWWKDKPDRKINTGNKHEITEEAKWPRKHIKHVQL